MNWILTASARQFHYREPAPEAISILDIATHLAREPRFAGATRRTYNVAQHSWFVSHLVPRGFELEGGMIPSIAQQVRAAIACQQAEAGRIEKQRDEVRRYAKRTEAVHGKRVKKKPARRT